MTTLNSQIFNHDSDVDIAHKINAMELDNWINHLKYIKKELVNLINLCSKEIRNKLDDDYLLSKFNKRETETENLLNNLNKYYNLRVNIMECEDNQCDMSFIKEHEIYRRSYLYHLDKYRRVKDEFYKSMESKINYFRKA